MRPPEALDGIPEAVPVHSHWEEATILLEQAARIGKPTPELLYLLGLGYKRQGKTGEARAAFRKVTPPDANVLTQLGLLSYREGQYAQAAGEFAAALEADAQNYPAASNLLLCRLNLGDFGAAAAALPRAAALAPGEDDRQFLGLLELLLLRCREGTAAANGGPPAPADNGELLKAYQALAGVSAAEERRLLRLLTGVRRVEAVFPLLQALAGARPNSQPVQQTYLEAVLVRARRLADRGLWDEADRLLGATAGHVEAGSPLAAALPNELRVAFLNLFGVSACLRQDFDRAARLFADAVALAPDSAWLYQNLALAYELMGRMDQAELHWNRYFELLDRRTPGPARPDYADALAYTALTRLADQYSKQEKWTSALGYLQRAVRLRPRDPDALERLFHAYVQVRRPEDARRTLRKLREVQPDDPQLDLYELDLREVRGLDDVERLLGDIKRILGKHPGDMRVEDRAMGMVANFLPLIGRRCEQLSDKLAHIVDQVRRLPNYQINWPVVHDEMHYLRHEFQKLRKLANKCLALVGSEEHRRVIRDLNQLIDQKIDVCVSMGG